jgi:hypothetical protein
MPVQLLAYVAFYERMGQFIPKWLALTASLGAAVYLVAVALRPRWLASARFGRAAAYAAETPKSALDWRWLVFGSTALLLALDGGGFTRGFFRQDDFAFMQDTHEPISFGSYLTLYESDHSCPIFRLEVWALARAAGNGATSGGLTALFNVASFSVYLCLLLSGCWLLVELGARRVSLALFCLVLWFWPSWGEYTAGFYSLSLRPQTMVLGFASAAMLLRALRTSRMCWVALSLVSACLAAGVDSSGIWVLPTLAGFAWAVSRAAHKRMLSAFAAGAICAFALTLLYHLVLTRHAFSARELVQNPSAFTFRDLLRHSLSPWLPVSVLSGLGGTILSVFTPPVIQILQMRPVDHWLSLPIRLIESLVCLGAIQLAWRLGRQLPTTERRVLAALSFPVIITVIMCLAARPSLQGTPGVYWSAKYTCLPYCWLAMAGTYLADRAFLFREAKQSRPLLCVLAITIFGGWMSVSYWYFEKAMPMHSPWMPGGRYHNVLLADLRRDDFERFDRDAARVAELTGMKTLSVPALRGAYWKCYPYLELGDGGVLGKNYQFQDLLSVAPSRGLRLVQAGDAEISQKMRRALDEVPEFGRLFISKEP